MEYVGIDVHKNQSQICLITEAGEVLHQRIAATSLAAAAEDGPRHLLAWVLFCHSIKVIDEGAFSIRDMRIVLPVIRADKLGDRLGGPAFVEH